MDRSQGRYGPEFKNIVFISGFDFTHTCFDYGHLFTHTHTHTHIYIYTHTHTQTKISDSNKLNN